MFDLFYILKCIFLISYSKIWICIFQILPNGFKEQGRKEGRGSWCIKDWEQQVCHFNLKVKILNQKIFKFLSFTMFHNVLQSFPMLCNIFLQCFWRENNKEKRKSDARKNWKQHILIILRVETEVFPFAMFCNVLVWFAKFCNVLKCFAMFCKVLQCFAMFCCKVFLK